jgi:hypothetical protein
VVDRDRCRQCSKAAGVVAIEVGDEHPIEPAHPAGNQVGKNEPLSAISPWRGWSGIDEQVVARRLQMNCLTLTDVK